MKPTRQVRRGVSRLPARQPKAWHLYVGVTNDLARRVHEHRIAASRGFTATYGVTRLVWYESYTYIAEAIDREKALKKWRRDWEIGLIEDFNPDWSDLSPTLSGWTGS